MVARIGVMVPSSNTVVERDARRVLPPDVHYHVARIYLAEARAAAERVMLDVHVPRAADDLATCLPEVVAFCCTSGGAILGTTGEAELIGQIASVTKAAVVSTNEAVSLALAARGAKRVGVITPYVQELNAAIASTLAARGFEVAEIHGMGITENFAIAEVEPEQIVAFAVDRLRGDFDTVFASCTNYRAMEAIPGLERELGRPVVTSNAATFERVLEVLQEHDGSSVAAR